LEGTLGDLINLGLSEDAIMGIDFNAKMNEFTERIRAATITPTTDVVLTFHVADPASGRRFPPQRRSVMPTIPVAGQFVMDESGTKPADAIIAEINSQMQHYFSPTFARAQRLVDVEMEIIGGGP
jgi:hypothetical protein